jgi:hypothetical protein
MLNFLVLKYLLILKLTLISSSKIILFFLSSFYYSFLNENQII